MGSFNFSQLAVLIRRGAVSLSFVSAIGCAHAGEDGRVLVDPRAISGDVKFVLVGVVGEDGHPEIVLLNRRTGAEADLCVIASSNEANVGTKEETGQKYEDDVLAEKLPPCRASDPVQIRDLQGISVIEHDGSSCTIADARGGRGSGKYYQECN